MSLLPCTSALPDLSRAGAAQAISTITPMAIEIRAAINAAPVGENRSRHQRLHNRAPSSPDLFVKYT
jgi:hypothetical protein